MDKTVKYVIVGWLLTIVAMFGVLFLVGNASAGSSYVPGQCTAGISYQQLVVFKSNSTDVNEYLSYINQIQGCDVHISTANDSPGQFGYFIWFKENYLTNK